MCESISAVDQVERKSIASVHSDILQSHVLTRLDGPALASFSSASSVLHHLSSEERLWKTISTSTWPSINTPRVQDIISTFPSGHRSFFSDSYPLLTTTNPSPEAQTVSDILISSVDIYYKEEVVFSRTQELDTTTSWFRSSPLRVELLDPKEYVATSVVRAGPDARLEENLTLSWIIIDPARKRAANISSNKPVSVQRHWLTGDVQARYATVLRKPEDGEYVTCGVVVTCCGGEDEGEEMNVREVSMQVEDMEGKTLNGEESLVILQGAVVNGGRRRGDEGRKRREYEEFVEMKRRRRVKKQRRERTVDLVFIGISVTFFVAFWSYVFLRIV